MERDEIRDAIEQVIDSKFVHVGKVLDDHEVQWKRGEHLATLRDNDNGGLDLYLSQAGAKPKVFFLEPHGDSVPVAIDAIVRWLGALGLPPRQMLPE